MSLPKSSVPSVAKYMSGLQMADNTEKSLMIRIGTLMDAIIAAQRGTNNAGSNLDQKSQKDNLNTPPVVTGTTSDLFNGISVNLDPIADSNNLSNYEVQVDTDPNFSDPTTKSAFNTDMTFKGLTSETDYFVRVRALTKNGVINDWSSLAPVTTGASPGGNTASVNGNLPGEDGTSDLITFNSNAEDEFVVSNFGLRTDDGSADFYLRLYMDDVLQETLTLLGPQPATAPFTYDDSEITVIRYWPLAFFTLIEPGDSPSTHTFTVRTPDGNLTTEPVVFVKF